MDYCTQADLVERFGLVELAQLTDETAAASPDSVEIAKSCAEASSLIDAYLSTRYTVPVDPVPTVVRKWAADIARKFLWKDRARADSAVTLNYDQALLQLKDASKGIAGLPSAGGLPAVTTGSAISVVASDRIFTDDLLTYMPG